MYSTSKWYNADNMHYKYLLQICSTSSTTQNLTLLQFLPVTAPPGILREEGMAAEANAVGIGVKVRQLLTGQHIITEV